MKLLAAMIVGLILFCPLYAQLDGVLWTKTYGGENDDYARCIEHAEDGGYIILAETYSFGDSHIWMLKVDFNGDSVWSQMHNIVGSERPSLLRGTSDSGYIIVGSHKVSSNPDNLDMFLIKTDESGNLQWSQSYDFTFIDSASSVDQTPDGGYIFSGLIGDTTGASLSTDLVVKTDSLGNIEFTNSYMYQIYTGDLFNYGFSIRRVDDDNYYYGLKIEICDGADIYLLKLNAEGEFIWSNYIESGFTITASDIEISSDNAAILCGYNNHYIYGPYGTLSKTDLNGNIVFNNINYSTNSVYYNSRANNHGGATVIAQYAAGIWLFDVDSTGNETWSSIISSPGTNEGVDIISNADSNYIAVLNSRLGGSSDNDIKLICYEIDSLYVEPYNEMLLLEFILNSPYPNPFNANTSISFQLPAKSYIEMSVFDIAGREVATLIDGYQTAGTHEITFNAKDLVSGVYFARLTVDGGQSMVRKIVLMK